MKFLLALTCFFITLNCFAQRQNVYYIKYNGAYVDNKDSADFIRIVREPDSASVLYNVFEFYINGNKKLIGKSTAINPPRFEGLCVTYYKSGLKESINNYKNGNESGLCYEYYPNGKPYMVKEYPADGALYAGMLNNFLIIANYDSLGTIHVEKGEGYYKEFDSKLKYITEEGTVKNGKRNGVWKGNFKNFNTTFTEHYEDGKLINGTAIFSDSSKTVYNGTRATAPQFKGGETAFGTYLANHIQYPDYDREKGVQGTVIIEFVVEKDGALSDIKVKKAVTPSLDRSALNVLKHSPKWVPGTMFGRPARVSYSVPVSFSLTD
jgi:TonB family protein